MTARQVLICFACVLAFLSCPQPSPAAAPRRVHIGNGSGYLRYLDAQATLKLRPGDTLYIDPGTYSGLSLGNLSGTGPMSPSSTTWSLNRKPTCPLTPPVTTSITWVQAHNAV